LFDAEAQDKTPAARRLAARNEPRVRCMCEDPACAAPQTAARPDETADGRCRRARGLCQPPPLQCRVCQGKRTASEVRRLRLKPD